MYWIICKESRKSEDMRQGYGGLSCDDAGVPKSACYLQWQDAVDHAQQLTKVDPVGFCVLPIWDREPEKLGATMNKDVLTTWKETIGAFPKENEITFERINASHVVSFKVGIEVLSLTQADLETLIGVLELVVIDLKDSK